MRLIKAIIVVLILAVIGIGAAVYSGVYNVAADAPQSTVTRWALQQIRHYSIAARATEVVAPTDLDDPARLAEGAEHYGEMCAQCHLAPGMQSTELRAGLDPKPPKGVDLAEKYSPQRLFWAIKHGITMTAMPAWGVTHSDEKIWDIVAFVRQLPRLSPAQYQKMTGAADAQSAGHDHDHDHAPAE